MRRGSLIACVLVLVALAAGAGCASITEEQKANVDAWQKVETERAQQWGKVHEKRAATPRGVAASLEPIDPTKPINARLSLKVDYPETNGALAPPEASPRPQSTVEAVADTVKSAPKEAVKALLGYRGIEAAEKVLIKGYDSAGRNTTIGGSNVGGNQIEDGGTYVGGDQTRDSNNQDNDTTNTTTTTETTQGAE